MMEKSVNRKALILFLSVLILAGCVHRTMTIRTQPPGALIYLNNEEKGITPETIPFTWYGDYEIVLKKEGYQTLSVIQPIKPPWYEVFPLDIFSELLLPVRLEDEHFLHYELTEAVPVDKDVLLRQADQLREEFLIPDEE
jgi:hypothetical protein